MKAILYRKYGTPEVLEMKEVEKPIPQKNEVLIKIHATSVTTADTMMRRADSFISRIILGLGKPKKKYRILGIEFAGEIESLGPGGTKYRRGDRVYGFSGFSAGCYAEYLCVGEKSSLAIKPANLNFQEAVSMVDGASTADFFLRDKAKIQKRDKVLIIGASGSIGSYGVQLARYYGADVTGVCSTANMELVKSLGAHWVIDYTKEDFTRKKGSYDIIFDTVGKSSFSKSKASLKKNGRYLTSTGKMMKNYFLTIWTSLMARRKFIFAMSVDKVESLNLLKKLAEAGIIKPIIDRTYPLEEMVEAHRYVEMGHKKGNVVIRVN